MEFNYNEEVVIHHILEGSLPPHLLPDEHLNLLLSHHTH